MEKDNIHLPQNADTFSLGAGLSISTNSNIKKTISITNNRAHYFANLAKKFRDEAKVHCENAKHYAEENSNVTYDQLIDLRKVLETEINSKQDVGNYALKSELPINVSELENDADYATKTEMNSAVDSVRLPDCTDSIGKYLTNDGTNFTWEEIPREKMFSIKWFDKVLSFEESKGYALQGTYVNKNSSPECYGYPEFYAKCIEEKNAGTETQTTLGEITITTYNNANGHIFYNLADKEAIDTFFDTYGVCWMYGIDEENERVFLPRNNWFMQVTTDISSVNKFNEAGVPNIVGEVGPIGQSGTVASGAFFKGPSVGPLSNDGQWDPSAKFDASRCSSVYGKSDTVQPASSNKLLYIVVGNTEQEAALTNVTQITTSENDTIPLFTGMYFDFAPNNVSWLKAGQQANSSGMYSSCYNTLVNCLNGTNPYNLKVIDFNDMELEVDYSDYWKVNQENMTFTTPTKLSFHMLNGDIDTIPVRGNGMVLSLTNGTTDYGLRMYSNTGLRPQSDGVGKELPIIVKTGAIPPDENALGISMNSEVSGVVAETSGLKSNLTQLYFKVANAVQDLQLLNAGEVIEVVNAINESSIQKTSTTDKREVMAWFMPDYENAVSFTSTTFTVPNYGWIFAITFLSGSGTGYAYLNGVDVAREASGYCGTHIFVQPGDVFSCNGTVVTAKFLPAKGA